MPVLYSPAMSSTPSVPNASWANVDPGQADVDRVVGFASPGPPLRRRRRQRRSEQADADEERATATARVMTVERSDQNLIHSELIDPGAG